MIQLYAGTASQALGQRVAEQLSQPLSTIQTHRFSDGELYAKLKPSVEGAHVCLIQATYPPTDHLMELLLAIDAAKQAGAHLVTVVAPYLGYARQDRLHHRGGSVGGLLQAKLLKSAGLDRLITCELHSQRLTASFDFPWLHLSSLPTFLTYIKQLQLPRLTFVAPDRGGEARARAYAQHFESPLICCNKLKEHPHQATAIQVQGEVKGADAIIIDDIIDTGRTVYLVTQQLKAQGARTVRAFCTHALFSGDVHTQLLQAGLEEIVVTDTVPLKQPSRHIQVHSMAPIIAQSLRQEA